MSFLQPMSFLPAALPILPGKNGHKALILRRVFEGKDTMSNASTRPSVQVTTRIAAILLAAWLDQGAAPYLTTFERKSKEWQ